MSITPLIYNLTVGDFQPDGSSLGIGIPRLLSVIAPGSVYLRPFALKVTTTAATATTTTVIGHPHRPFQPLLC